MRKKGANLGVFEIMQEQKWQGMLRELGTFFAIVHSVLF
jgi:hypothetical protein